MARILILLSILTLSQFAHCRTVDASVQYQDSNKNEIGIFKVAVLLFDIEDAKWGDEFTDAISLHISKKLPVRVIEREQLSKVVNEQSFSKTGIIDTQTAVRLGKILGVDALVFGRGTALKKFDEKGRVIPNLIDTVSLKVVHIESGQVIINGRKKPGTDWSAFMLTKYILGLSLIWSREDILLKTSEYDYVAESLVSEIQAEMPKLR